MPYCPASSTFCREWLLMDSSVCAGLWFSRAPAMAPPNSLSIGDLPMLQACDVAPQTFPGLSDLQWTSFKIGFRRCCNAVVPLPLRFDHGITDLFHPSWLFLFLLLLSAHLPFSVAGANSESNEESGSYGDLEHCEDLVKKKTVINYAALHACVFHHSLAFSVPFLLVMVLLAFYILATAAQSHFSPVVARLAEMLHLSPSTGGVTLLALGNGAPDVFASIASVWGGNPRIGLGAIVSAGLFVSAFVVGFVALAASPFSLKPTTFLRDVCFYFLAVTLMFLVYMSGEVYAWQAIGLVSLYVFFVVVVFSMDHERGNSRALKQSISDIDNTTVDDLANDTYIDVMCHSKASGHIHCNGQSRSHHDSEVLNFNSLGMAVEARRFQPNIGASDVDSSWKARQSRSLSAVLGMLVCTLLSCGHMDSIRFRLKPQLVWQLPVEVMLRSTIPAVDLSKWNRFYASLNLVCCPLIILYIISAAVSPYRRLVFIVPGINLPLWSLVLMQGSVLGLAYYVFTKEPPKNEVPIAVVTAFVMSVFWISFIAGELLGCLATLGKLLKLPPALLGLTVLAWGNSIGDLVADVAVARAGQPAMAMAGCFAGPMFNMLVGFGLALSMKASRMHPAPYQLEYNPSIVIAFGFLFVSLLGSLLVVSWSKFQVPRFWGFCLIALYITFVIVSISNANLL